VLNNISENELLFIKHFNLLSIYLFSLVKFLHSLLSRNIFVKCRENGKLNFIRMWEFCGCGDLDSDLDGTLPFSLTSRFYI
jgi:hypothetical protein